MMASISPIAFWLFMCFEGVVSFRDDAHSEYLDVEKSHYNSTAKGKPRCYCKEVKGPDECIDNMYPDEKDRMDGPQFYHSHSVGRAKPLCCKREDSGWVNSLFGIEWDYRSQPDMSLCDTETAAVPATSCCHVWGQGDMGIRVSSAYAEFREEEDDYDKIYKKSVTTVKFSDVSGAVDFDGTELSSQDVQAFIRRSFSVNPENEILACQEDIRSIAKGSDSECRLRAGVPRECCCLSMTLEPPPSRCLEVAGAPTEVPEELQIETEFKSIRAHDLPDTTFTMRRPQEPQTDSYITRSDPERGDDFAWEWSLSSSQWWQTCLEYRTVPEVESYRASKQVSYQTTERYYNGRSWLTRHVTKHKTVHETKYRNKQNKVCALTKWTRHCPAGKSKFFRQVPKGQCLSSSTGLVAGPDFTYVCPTDYTNAKQNERCSCDESCLHLSGR